MRILILVFLIAIGVSGIRVEQYLRLILVFSLERNLSAVDRVVMASLLLVARSVFHPSAIRGQLLAPGYLRDDIVRPSDRWSGGTKFEGPTSHLNPRLGLLILSSDGFCDRHSHVGAYRAVG